MFHAHLPWSFGRDLRGFKNLKFMVSEKDVECNLDSVGPMLAPRSLFSSGFGNNNCSLMSQISLAVFIYGQHFHLTGNPHIAALNISSRISYMVVSDSIKNGRTLKVEVDGRLRGSGPNKFNCSMFEFMNES